MVREASPIVPLPLYRMPTSGNVSPSKVTAAVAHGKSMPNVLRWTSRSGLSVFLRPPIPSIPRKVWPWRGCMASYSTAGTTMWTFHTLPVSKTSWRDDRPSSVSLPSSAIIVCGATTSNSPIAAARHNQRAIWQPRNRIAISSPRDGALLTAARRVGKGERLPALRALPNSTESSSFTRPSPRRATTNDPGESRDVALFCGGGGGRRRVAGGGRERDKAFGIVGVPEADFAVPASGRQLFRGRVERHTVDPVVMAGEGTHGGAVGDLVLASLLVGAATENPPVGRNHDAVDLTAESADLADLLGICRVPRANLVVAARRQDLRAIRRERHAVHHF